MSGVGREMTLAEVVGRLAPNHKARIEYDEFVYTVRRLLGVIAMLPEDKLTGLLIDPYGTIGDALNLIGESREPDSWRALHRAMGFPDPEPSADAMSHAESAKMAADVVRQAEKDEAEWERMEAHIERLEDALAEAHRALGGDGTWCAKLGPLLPPGKTGDLAVDVPAMARRARGRFARDILEGFDEHCLLVGTNMAIQSYFDILVRCAEEA